MNTSLKKQHLKTVIFRSYLFYLNKFYPDINIEDLCKKSGLPLEYILNENNWVSIEFEKRFMEEIKKSVNNKDLLFEVGKLGTDIHVIGRAIYFLCRYIFSLESVYAKLPFVTSLLNKVISMQRISHTSGRVIYKISPKYEILNEIEKEIINERLLDFLENTRGYYSSIPTAKNLQHANVKIVLNNEATNEYIIDVTYPKESNLINVIFSNTPFLLSPFIYLVLKNIFSIKTEAIVGTFVFVILGYYLKLLLMYKTAKMIGNETESMLVNLDKQYKELYTSQLNLKRKLDETEVINKIVDNLIRTESKEEILNKSCKCLVEIINYDRAVILLADEKDQKLHYGASFGESERLTALFRSLKLDINISSDDPKKISNVFKDSNPLLIENVEDHLKSLIDPQSKVILTASESKSFACVPIKTNNKKFGVLIADCVLKGKKMNHEDLSLLAVVGLQIGITLEKELAKEEVIVAYRKEIELSRSYSRFVPWESLNNLNYKTVFDVKIGDGQEKNLTLLFSDIRNFSNLCESMSPIDTLRFLNSYFGKLSPIISKYSGYVDKFIGDCMMAIFNDPEKAIAAGIEIQREIIKYNLERRLGNRRIIEAGIGICEGPTIIGPLGFNDRLEITVLSDTVNTASRLDGLCKKHNAKILCSGIDLKTPSLGISYLSLGLQPVKGKDILVPVTEIVDEFIFDNTFDKYTMTDANEYVNLLRGNIDIKLKRNLKTG
jgi:class 3 adenylate cyclase